jgi:recombination protein RecA
MRVTDQLLQGGGLSAIVLDMASLAPEYISRIPLATWFRYRAAAERTQSSILLLTQHTCAKSSAELLLRLQPGKPLCEETTVFCGLDYRLEVARQRFAQAPSNVVPIRKPPQNAHVGCWQSKTAWAGRR